MNIKLEPGVYVLAVSGGVDSMVLLHMLMRQHQSPRQEAEVRKPETRDSVRFVVAHLDHGIRPDSDADRVLVENAAKQYEVPFVYDSARLGPDTSEAQARKARYDFLRRVQGAAGADAIITAHHQDDLLETAILNLLRGTGRKGLSSLADEPGLRRPLLGVPKYKLHAYAKKHAIEWNEDATNQDTAYKRNYVRHHIVGKMSQRDRQKLLSLFASARTTNQALDLQIASFLQFVSKGKSLDRALFIGLPHKVAMEIMAEWLRRHEIRQFDKKLLERLVTAGKALAPGKQTDVDHRYYLAVRKTTLELQRHT